MRDEGLPFTEAFELETALRHGWHGFTRFWPVLFVGGCLKSCTEGGAGNGGSSGSDEDKAQGALDALGDLPVQGLLDGVQSDFPFDPKALTGPLSIAIQTLGMATFVAIALLAFVVLFVFRAWLVAGWIKLHRAILAEERGDFPTLFSGASHLVPMLLWTLLEGCILVGTAAIFVLPAIGLTFWISPLIALPVAVGFGVPVMVYVVLGLSFGAHAVVLEDLGPVEAFRRSWELADGRRAHLLLFRFILALVRILATIVGLCVFCLGALVTGPIGLAVTELGFTEAYLLHVRPRSETALWPSRHWP